MSKGKKSYTVGAVALALAVVFAAVGSVGALSESGPIAATDEKAPGAPPSLLATPDLVLQKVTLEWARSPSDMVRPSPVGTDFTSGGTYSNVNDVAGYLILRRAGSGVYEVLNPLQLVRGTTFEDPTLLPGIPYTYQVIAMDAAGNPSGPAESTPVSIGPPAKKGDGKPEVPPGTIVSKKARLKFSGTPPPAGQQQQFIDDLVATLAKLLGVSPGRIKITSITAGSINVDFTIEPDPTGTEPTPDEAVTTLNTEVTSNPEVIKETAAAEGATTTFETVESLSSSNVADIAFGILGLDGTASQSWTFSNTSTDAEQSLIVNAAVSGAGYAITPETQTIAAGESGTVTVSFAAADVENLNGSYLGTATIRTNDPDNQETIANLSAAIAGGLDLPVLDLSGVSFKYGQVVIGTPITKKLTITNKGDLDLEVDLVLTGAAFTISTTSLLLTGGEAAVIDVVFTPTEAVTALGSIAITSNDPNRPSSNVTLSGLGVTEITGPLQGVNAAGEIVLGFLDEDNDVDLDDFFKFADVFGTKLGDADYNPQADFIPNDIIDLDDFFKFADYFGEVAVSFQ